MRRSIGRAALAMGVVAVAIVALVGAGLVVGQSTATIQVDAPETIERGSTASGVLIATGVSDADGLGTFVLNLSYDPDALSIDASSAGGFDVVTASPGAGVLRIVGYTGHYPGPTGNVTLADLQITGDGAADPAVIDVAVENVTDAGGGTLPVAAQSATLRITTGGGGGPVGSGGPQGGTAAPVTEAGDETETEVTRPATNRARAAARNVRANEPVTIELPSLAEEGERDQDVGADLESITVTPAVDRDFTVDVTSTRDVPSGTPGVETARRASAFRYFEVEETLEADEMNELAFRYRVRKSRLAAGDQRPENVAMFRFADGAWTALPTRQVDETDTHLVFESTSPGTSVFAVGVSEPDIAVRDASLEATTVTVGDVAAVVATLENSGEGSGSITVDLGIDGTTVDTREVEVAAGDTRQVRFEWTAEDAGSFDVGVNGVSAGTLTVQEAAETTESPTRLGPATTEETPATDRSVEGGDDTEVQPGTDGTGTGDGDELGGLNTVAILAIVAIVAALALFAYYRRRR